MNSESQIPPNGDSNQTENVFSEESAEEVPASPTDDYEKLVHQVQKICESVLPLRDQQSFSQADYDIATSPPSVPTSLAETGLTLHQLCDLILKTIYLHGTMTGFHISRQLKLPFGVVEEALEFLKQQRLLDVRSGDVVGPISYRFLLSEQGLNRARDAFDECRYVGPAPVSVSEYLAQCRKQSTRNIDFTHEQLHEAFEHLVIDPDLFSRLGPAILTGQSIFLHGPPGNGKTVIGKAIAGLMNRCGGAIYVPYAIAVDQQIVTIFDPGLHRTLDGDDAQEFDVDAERSDHREELDGRWRLILRPVVITAGELTLEMLDLRYHQSSGFYSAPLHLKANGGVFMIDDLGRQQVAPAALLNRWILPLEDRIDSLTLSTGKKFHVPFEQLTIFSSNMAPEDLGDHAFLRRIRHKIYVPAPSQKQFREIFRQACKNRGVRYDDWMVTQMLNTYYTEDQPPKSSDPRDLLDVIQSICRFRKESFHLREDLLAEAWRDCLGRTSGTDSGATL